jgi:hypothetical protein
VISVRKGEPTPDELAALVIALLLARAEQRAACVSHPSRWYTSGLRGRSWRAPAAWSAGMRPWTHGRP